MHSHPGGALPKLKNEQSICPQSFKNKRQKSLDLSPFGIEDDRDQSLESTPNQLVLYNSGISDTNPEVLPIPDPTEYRASSSPNFTVPNPPSRSLPSVGAFTVQCATCFKWRLIPTKEKYEEIRENLLQEPFVCERAREWRPDISCEEPADISQDGSRLWAIDKPNIAQPPPGWERLLRIRGEGSTKFADVYYASPSGKKLRSMVEVQKYLLEHPEHVREGVHLSQFSFQIPRPLQENYVRKRPARMANLSDGPDFGFQRFSEPADVNPLSWAGPSASSPKLQDGIPGSSTIHPFTGLSPAKKKSRPKQIHSRYLSVFNQPKINVEDKNDVEDDPQQVGNASSDP